MTEGDGADWSSVGRSFTRSAAYSDTRGEENFSCECVSVMSYTLSKAYVDPGGVFFSKQYSTVCLLVPMLFGSVQVDRSRQKGKQLHENDLRANRSFLDTCVSNFPVLSL